MAASGYDLASNWVAGVRITSKNQGAVGPTALKTGQGNSAISATLMNLTDTASIDTYLAASTAHGVGYYNTVRLAQMNKNDKIMAAKMIADPTSQR